MSKEHPRPNPFVGPRAFEEDDGNLFFGRSREERQLFQLLIARRIVLLHSPSGAGKSSLIQAGLVPRLKDEGFKVLPTARLNAPPPKPLASIEGFNRYIYSLLLSLQEQSADHLDEELANLSLPEFLEPYYGSADDPQLVVLIIDQFEEVLTADPTDVDEKAQFFAEVGRALRKPNLWGLFVIREDYLGALAPYVRAVPTRLEYTFRLDLLDVGAASEAITMPAVTQGVPFTDAAVEALVEDLSSIQVQLSGGEIVAQAGRYVEPVQLQVVCHRLWQNLSPGQSEITEEDLQTIGNVDDSLAAYYADQVAAFENIFEIDVRERDIRRWIDNSLITKDGVRLQVLKGQNKTEGLDNRVIEKLVSDHLMRIDKRAGMTWYELAHDRLIKPVQKNNSAWFEVNLSLLQRRAQWWQEEGGPDYLLLDGPELQEAAKWAEQHPDDLNDNDQTFLQASQDKRKQSLRRIWIALGVMIIIIIGALSSGYFGIQATRNAALAQTREAQANTSATREANANFALATRNVESANAFATADAAKEEVINAQATAISAIATAVDDPLEQATAQIAATNAAAAQATDSANRASANATATALPQQVAIFTGHTGPVFSASFSPDGQQIVTASADGSAKVWDLAGNEVASLEGHEGGVTWASFSPDGGRIVTASSDGSAKVWDLAANELVSLEGHNDAVYSASFSPNGQQIVTSSVDGSAKLWDLAGNEVASLQGHEGLVYSASFSPNGQQIVTASADGSAKVWDLEGNEETSIEGHVDRVTSASFSPDGQQIVTASVDGSAKLWDLAGNELASLEGHQGVVTWASFSPDGQQIVTASDDTTARVWDVEKATTTAVLTGHASWVGSAVFSPNGDWILTAGGDATARVWSK